MTETIMDQIRADETESVEFIHTDGLWYRFVFEDDGEPTLTHLSATPSGFRLAPSQYAAAADAWNEARRRK